MTEPCLFMSIKSSRHDDANSFSAWMNHRIEVVTGRDMRKIIPGKGRNNERTETNESGYLIPGFGENILVELYAVSLPVNTTNVPEMFPRDLGSTS